jgi:large subunit ribosomal protein L35
MPKMKSNRSAMKRFRKTGTGKVRRNQAFHGHIFTSKSPKRKRHLRQSTLVSKADAPRVKRMISGK